MDGRTGRLKGSLQFRLSLMLASVIVVVSLLATTVSFFAALGQEYELQDEVLYQTAGLVSRQDAAVPLTTPQRYQLSDRDNDSFILVQFLPETKEVGQSGVGVGLGDGFHTIKREGHRYRLFVTTTASGAKIIVSQDLHEREEGAFLGALGTLLPLIVLIPTLLIIIALLIRRVFKPVRDISLQIDQRPEGDLRPIPDSNIPTEIHFFVLAINRLLERVSRLVGMQRRFVAGAAHELRTPLTALSLQAESLAQTPLPALARERLLALQHGIERNRRLLNQLLRLSHVESQDHPTTTLVPVELVYRRVLEDLMPIAMAKRIDLGVSECADVAIRISAVDLFTVVKNMADNALRYTPEGGRVDLSCSSSDREVVIRVADTGPGIPISERRHVFDAFYRIVGNGQEGSGLGLSIVRAISERIGARIELDYTDAASQCGLAIHVAIPMPPHPVTSAGFGEPSLNR